MQLSILPRDVPRPPGLDIAARYLPMSSVAGDFYDFFGIDQEHFGVLIAAKSSERGARKACPLEKYGRLGLKKKKDQDGILWATGPSRKILIENEHQP